MENEEFVEEIKKKISSIPNFPKSTIESLLNVWSAVTDRRKERIENKINKIVDSAYNRHILRSKNPVLPFPSQEESRGDGITMGQVCSGDIELYPYGLTRVNLTENIFGVGRAGSGKTTFILYFVDQLEFHKIKYIVIDWKNDYSFLAKKYSGVYLLKYYHLQFNPWTNVPPGMDKTLWWFIVLDVIAHSTGLYVATPSHVLEALDEIYEAKNGRINTRDLYQYLKAQNETSRREEYNITALNRLFLLNKILDPVINVDYGFDIAEVFRQKCVIQMAPLHEAVSSFLFNILALWEYYRRLYSNVRADWKSAPLSYFLENFRIFVMDEAHLTQYSGHEHKDITIFSPPPLSTFFSQSRELGLATCAFTQFPDLVMSAFRTNAGTKIIGNVVESDAREHLAASLGLDRRDENLLGKLDKGMWIVNVAGRTKKPFLMKTPMVEKPIIAEEELLAISKPLLSKLQMKRQEIEAKMFLQHVDKKSSDNIHLPSLPQDAWLFLDYVFANPWDYQQKVTEALGFSDRKIAGIKKLLVEKNLIRIEKFAVKVHERIHFILTPNALDVMKTVGKSPQMIAYWRFISKPSYQHRYFQHRLRSQHRILGWKGRLEYDMNNGRRVDIYEERDGYRKAIEIELSTKDLDNKIRVLDEVDELVLLYNDETHLQFAKSKLLKMDGIPGERVWLGLVRDYTDLLDEIIQKNVVKAPETTGNIGSLTPATPDDDPERKPDGDIGEKS